MQTSEIIRSYRQIRTPAMVPALPWWLTGAAVDLDFSNNRYYGGTLGSLLSTSRASSGYATNGDGTLTSFANDTPRIGVGTGLLVEEARTNLIIQSQEIGTTGWSDIGGITSGFNVIAAPDGTNTADSFVETATNSTHYVGNSFNTITANAPYTYSCYVKAGTRTQVQLMVYSTGFANLQYARFDLPTLATIGSFGSVNAITGSGVQALGNGWYRCWFTGVLDASSTTAIMYMMALSAGNDTYLGIAGDTALYVWGAQQEVGAFATSYIPTTTVAVTRAADVVTSLFPIVASAGSFFVQETVNGITNANSAILGAVSTTDRPLYLSGFSIHYGDSVGDVGTANAITFGTAFKAASSFNGGGASVVLNGGTAATGAFAATLSGNGGLFFGGNSIDGGHAGAVYIQRTTFWNSHLADATLQGLTA